MLLSDGSETPPFFTMVDDKLAAVLPNATRKTFAGAGHIPHVTHPQEYADAIVEFAKRGQSAGVVVRASIYRPALTTYDASTGSARTRALAMPHTFSNAVRATSVPSSRRAIS